ncbi:MAG: Ig-like domain-containing protein, partial [Elusimicrobia bacterium]|nr:Ig-like domain-containing protein [Elusimicrobiota bacterium]
ATAAPRLPLPLDEGWTEMSSGWITATTHTFTGLYAQTNYRARVKSRGQTGAETEFVELAVQRTEKTDVLAPRTSLSTGPAYGEDPLYVSGITTFTFTVADDHLVAGDADGVGGTSTFVSIDGSSFAVSTAAFVLSAGTHTLSFYSVDFLENVESSRTLNVFVDTVAPISNIVYDGPYFQDIFFNQYVSTVTKISFDTVDPVDSGGASGVSIVYLSTTGQFADLHPFSSTLTFADLNVPPGETSNYHLFLQPFDHVGNVGTGGGIIAVDTAAPNSYLMVFGASTRTAAGLYAKSDSIFRVGAVDVGFTSSQMDALRIGINGVVTTHRQDGIGGIQILSNEPSPGLKHDFLVSAGSHTLTYDGVDHVENYDSHSEFVFIDDDAPSVAVLSPSGGETFDAESSTIAVRFETIDELDPAPFVSAALVQVEDRGSPRGSRPASVIVTAGQDLGPYALDDGLWRLEATATDVIGNSTTVVSGSFEVTFPADALPPRTTVSVGTPTVTSGGALYVSGKTSLTLSAIDDLNTAGDGLGYGVKSSSISLDGGPFTLTAPSFSLDAEDGPRLLAFYSEDVFGRVESTQTFSLVLDNTPPLLSLTAPADGAALLSSTVTITLTYSDPAAGVNASAVSVFVDGQDRTALASIGPTGASLTVVLADGRHRVWAQTADRLGNVSTDALYFRVDRGPAVLASVRADAASPALGPYGTLTEVLAGADFSSPVGLSTGGLSLLLDGVPQAASMTFQTSASPNWAPNPVITVGLITGGSLAMDRGRLILIGGLYQYSDWRRKCVVIEAADPSNVVPFDNCLPAPRSYAQTFLVDNVLYVAGGQADSDSTREVWYSFLAANGAPQEWRKSAPLLTTFDPGVAHQGIMGAAHVAVPTPSGTRLYILSGESYNNEYWGGLTALIRPDKTLGPWTRAIISSPNMSFDSHIGDNAVYHNGHIYLQGRNLMGMGTLILPLDANGLITNQNNSWAPAIPDTLYRGTLFVAKGRLHHIGGRDYSQPGEPWVTRAYSAQIAADGSVGAWQAETASYAMDGGAAGVMDDVVYAGPAAHFYSSNEFAMVQARSFSDRAVSASLRVPASLAESAHEIAASGSDLRGVAGAGLASYIVDLTTPVSRVETSGSSRTVEGVLRVAAQSALSIAATDPLVAGAAAGIDFTRVSVDGGAEQDGAAFQVAAGAHSLVFYSRDRAGNQEAPQTLSLFAEGDAPAAVADLAATDATANSATLAWTSVGDDGQDGVIEAGETRVHFSTYAAGFSIAAAQYAAAIVNEAPGQPREAVVTGLLPGTSYYFKLWTRDTLGNYSDASNTAFAATPGVQDVTPPVTAFAPSTAALALGGTDFYPGSAYFGFVSTDAESGVARVEYRLDGSTEAFAVYAGTFSLAEGARSLEFAGVDVAGNREAESDAAFFVDASAPLTVLEVEGVSGTDAEGRLAVSTSTLLLLTASDLPSPGTAAGTAETVFSLNGPLDAGATVYAGPFALETGLYTLRFASTDRVGNREADKVQELAVSTRPVNAPPGAVTDLAAATAEDGGGLTAAWTAPDDDAEPGLALHGT